MTYTSVGKQLLRGREHIGDFATPELAAAIADVLNGQVLLDTRNERADQISAVLWP